MSQVNKPKTSTGLEPNIEGLLCYVLGWITGIIFLIIEKENTFVRFHAVQSIIVFGVLTIAFVLGVIPVIGGFLNWITWVITFILWIVLMYKAYKGEKWMTPIAGPIADRNSKPAAK